MTTADQPVIGFIGLGVMGGPMCRNMALKHPGDVITYDAHAAAFAALDDTRAIRAGSVAEVAACADIVFLSLPGGSQVEAVCTGPGGLAEAERKPAIVVDLSTTSVEHARAVAAKLAVHGIAFVDAPVARTREAAQRGELSVMVGAPEALFARVEPLLHYIGTDVTLCGDTGCGQVVKLVNNALVFENTLALAEMMVIGERAGVAPATLLDAVSKGSGDSFALRNHGRKSLLPRSFPEKSFPPEYALKDLGYVLELAGQVEVDARVARLAQRYYASAAEHGWAGRYYPAVIEVIDRDLPVDAPDAPADPTAA